MFLILTKFSIWNISNYNFLSIVRSMQLSKSLELIIKLSMRKFKILSDNYFFKSLKSLLPI